MIGFEGRGPAIQCMPNKHHHRYGFKLFCLCESSTGYTNSFSIYKGKNKNCSEHGLSHDICVELMQPLLDMGYHLYTDNWYTAVPLAEFLSSRNTDITGTVHANRKFLPAGVKQKLPKGESIAFRKNNLLCIGWDDKKHTSKYRRFVKNNNIYKPTKLRTHHARISEGLIIIWIWVV